MPLEMPAEVAQVEKTGLAGDAAHGQALQEQSLGACDAQLELVCVRRHAHLRVEQPRQMERAQAHQLSQSVQRHVLGVVVVQVGTRE